MSIRRLSAIAILLFAVSLFAQTEPNFAGHWRERTSSETKRYLEIQQNGKRLRVTTVVISSEGTRTLGVDYVIGGPETVYKGLDGDEFHSVARWNTNNLVFDIVEHEDSEKIPQTTIWTLSADGNSLQVDRQVTKAGKTTHSSATYIRQP
jgi:hypothetical protein